LFPENNAKGVNPDTHLKLLFPDKPDLGNQGMICIYRANHGNVFINCRFSTIGDKETMLARSPINHGRSYPFSEAVLINCLVKGLDPAGWGPVEGETANVHYWEYNSRNLSDSKPADVCRQHPATRQLTMEDDSAIIKRYSDPEYVLGGWSPVIEPAK
jgi:pectinesterase